MTWKTFLFKVLKWPLLGLILTLVVITYASFRMVKGSDHLHQFIQGETRKQRERSEQAVREWEERERQKLLESQRAGISGDQALNPSSAELPR